MKKEPQRTRREELLSFGQLGGHGGRRAVSKLRVYPHSFEILFNKDKQERNAQLTKPN
jgi:hypothetical protein